MHRGQLVRGRSGRCLAALGAGQPSAGQSLAERPEDLLLAGEAQVDSALAIWASRACRSMSAAVPYWRHPQHRVQDRGTPTSPRPPRGWLMPEVASRLAGWTTISEMLSSMG